MRIWLFALCYNEMQMLPFFLRHYAQWVSRMFFYDMGSTDGSQVLIAKHPKAECLPCPFVRMDDLVTAQFASREYRRARGNADWIIWVDVDEFICPQFSWEEALDTWSIRCFRVPGYQMVAREFPSNSLPITRSIQHGFRDSIYDKVCIFPPTIDLNWRPGRHETDLYPTPLLHPHLKLLHYRFLGSDYFMQRNERNYHNMTAENIQAGRGFHTYPQHVSGRYSRQWFEDRIDSAEKII